MDEHRDNALNDVWRDTVVDDHPERRPGPESSASPIAQRIRRPSVADDADEAYVCLDDRRTSRAGMLMTWRRGRQHRVQNVTSEPCVPTRSADFARARSSRLCARPPVGVIAVVCGYGLVSSRRRWSVASQAAGVSPQAARCWAPRRAGRHRHGSPGGLATSSGPGMAEI